MPSSCSSARASAALSPVATMRTSVICALNQLLDLKDLNTGVHSTRLAEWAVRVARRLGIAEENLYQYEVAALLHDVGKIGVPDAILKKPGKLTDEERAHGLVAEVCTQS